jgi:hypothetical protein
MSQTTHLRNNLGLTNEQIYGIEKSKEIKTAKIHSMRRTLITKRSDVYVKIFELLDLDKRQSEIAKYLNIDKSMVKRARDDRKYIEEILNENQ